MQNAISLPVSGELLIWVPCPKGTSVWVRRPKGTSLQATRDQQP